MITKAQKTRVIILISIVSIIAMYILFLLVGNKLLSRNDIYYIRFQKQSVTGLNIGQDVRYYGINIGKVTDITFNKNDISEIIIRIDVKHNTPLKKTVKANLTYIGITGLKQIELIGGENKDPNLKPGSYITASKSIMDNISGKAEVISEKIEKVMNNIIQITNSKNQEKFSELLNNLSGITASSDSILQNFHASIKDNKEHFNGLIRKVSNLTSTLENTAKNINLLVIDSRKLLNSPELGGILTNTAEITKKLNSEQISNIITNINKLTAEASSTITHIDKTIIASRKNFLKAVNLLKETLENINDFTIMIKDNPDIIIKGKDNEFE